MNKYKTPALRIIDFEESIVTDVVSASSQGNDTFVDYPTDIWGNGSAS